MSQLSTSYPLPDGADDDVYVMPVSFAQQRLWFLDQFEPNSPFYNMPAAVRLTGQLDVAALERALNAIVERHETLRTTFAVMDGEPVQVIAAELRLPLPLVDLTHLPVEVREAEALHRAMTEAARPFNLTRGPLLRASLLRLADNEHIALFTMHHIISDGWSVGVLVGEIGMLYAAFSQGQPSPLADLPIQYADYAVWQREYLQGEQLQRQLDYWKQQLGGAQPVLELPTDRPRPPVQSSRGASLSRIIPRGVTERVRELSRREGATLFMTLLAAFQTLLHRYSGQDDISVGTPIANRTRAELEGLIGFFVNTLVLRGDLAGDPSFRELLRRTREATLGAYAHQDLPFEQLVEVLQPARDMSHTPLFQVMFILQNAPTGQAQELPGLKLESLDTHSGTSTFDITLSISEVPEGLDLAAEFSTDLFDHATIERMLANYEQLLQSIAADPDCAVSRLPLLSAAERQLLVHDWNQTALPFPTDVLAHELIAAAAEEDPQAPAVIWNGETLRYGELNVRANQLAHRLIEHGVHAETIVGLCSERGFELIIGALGILKAGGAYLPLDPAAPRERLAAVLAEARPPLIVGMQAAIERLPEHDALTLCLDRDAEQLQQQPLHNPERRATPENLAYLIFTSGSTGTPKGVMVEQRNWVNQYFAWEHSYELRERARRHLQMAHFTFDVFSGDLIRALASGGTLVLCPREFLLEPAKLYNLMREQRIEIAEFVPAVLRGLIDHLEQSTGRLDFMRALICGSDSWYVGEYNRFRRFCGPETRLINSFGLTEAAIDSSFFEQSGLSLSADRLVPIGKPFANTRVYILDQHGAPAPIGVLGELFIGGAGVARGYLNRPDLTAERFVTLLEPPQRLYQTGDRARYLADGNIEFVGRLDHQIKIRGFRIEPGEIEAALNSHAALQAAVVLARADTTGQLRLVAYVVPNDELRAPAEVGEASSQAAAAQAVLIGDLRRYVQDRLPDYMVPSAFVVLERLPLLPNAKIDRNALPEPDWSQRSLEGDYVAPRSALEQQIADLFRQVLNVERVGAFDDFFQLGGHSLVATQLITRVRLACEADVPLRAIFESPTPALMAEAVEQTRQAAQGFQPPPVLPVSRDGELPLSFGQQRLWFLDQLEPNSPFYNIPDAVRLHGRLDVRVLERAINEIIRRHEVLRTQYHTVAGKPRLQIQPELQIHVPLIDIRHLPPEQREAEAMRLAGEEAGRPFDLTHGPLIRTSLIQLDDSEYLALLTLHHIVSDNWSSNLLVQELAVLYGAFAGGQPSPLPELAIQYADFAAWQRNWLQGEVLEAQLNYWKQQLGGAPPLLELPTDRPRPAVQSLRGAFKEFALTPQLTYALRSLSQREGATLFMTMLAALNILLHRYSGQEDICIGTPIAGRTRAEAEGLIGFFVNTLVLRSDLSGAPSFRTLLKRVRETSLGAYAHQDVPFEMLVDSLQVERNMSHTPLFQVMLVPQNEATGDQYVPGLMISPVVAHSGTSKYDLSIFTIEEGDVLTGALEYCADLFDDSTIDRLIGHFKTLLQAIVADPDCSIGQLPLLTAAERELMLQQWNHNPSDYRRDATIQQLFAEQALRTPEVAAVSFLGQELSFAELNSRANQLAHYLRNHGVGPETLVGLWVERSLDLIVGLMGILKAGGAYVPLDPSYPAERLAYIVEDARMPVVLTRAYLRDQGSPGEARLICLDADWDSIAQESTAEPEAVAGPQNLAYVIYTSGSTGRPKGVMIEHQAALNLANSLRRIVYDNYPGQQLRSSLNAPLLFDASVQQVLMMIYGHTLCIVPQDVRLDGRALLEWMRSERLDVFDCVPSQLKLALDAGMLTDGGPAPRLVLPGGEAIDEHTWERLAKAPASDFYNMYGPTECACDSTTCNVRLAGPKPNIGRPLLNVQCYILDKYMQPTPIGVAGELYIGGEGLGRGYFNRPDLTLEKFVENPFGPGRLYRTADLCRYMPDGQIEFLGRIDHQVKIRGFRIELGEIEAVLSSHPNIRETVVLAREDTPGIKRLVAYLVPHAQPGPSIAELRAHLQERLPEYMIPAAFMTLEAMPLTPNAKIDRKALPVPDMLRPELGSGYVAPRNQVEELLAQVWGEVLGLERVGIYDNFFELGGDSIVSIQVIARANARGLQLSPRQLFQAPTVAGLAELAGPVRLVQTEQEPVIGAVPLTPQQQQLLALPEPAQNNLSLLLRVYQPLDRQLLSQALERVLEHHDALRLRFVRSEQGWEQQSSAPGEPAALSWIDLSELPTHAQAAAISAAAAELHAGLDLSNGPLLRVGYMDLGVEQPARLCIVANRLILDAGSWPILLEDLQMAYAQLASVDGVRFPPKSSSFRQYAQRLTEAVEHETLAAEQASWAEQLAVAPALPLHNDGPLVLIRQQELDEQLSRVLDEELNAVGRGSAQEALLAALARAVMDWNTERGALIGLHGARLDGVFDDLEFSRTIGALTPEFGLYLAREAGMLQQLDQLRNRLAQVPRQGLGYTSLAQQGTLPWPQLQFVYRGTHLQPAETPLFGPALEPHRCSRTPQAGLEPALLVEAGLLDGRLQLHYFSPVSNAGSIDLLAGHLENALRELVEQLHGGDGAPHPGLNEFGWDSDDLSDILGELSKL